MPQPPKQPPRKKGTGRAKAGGKAKAAGPGKGKAPSRRKAAGQGKAPAAGKREAKQPRAGETQEYELGEDFLADLGDEQPGEDTVEHPQPAGAAGDEPPAEQQHPEEEELGAGEESPEQDLPEEDLVAAEEELTEIISAETQEWQGIEAAERQGQLDESEADKTLVASAKSAITSGFEAVGGQKVTSGFKAVGRHIRFPLWARFLTATLVITLSVGTATATSLLLYLDGIAADLDPGEAFGPNIQDKLDSIGGGEPQTIMIMGSDKRPEEKADKSYRGLSDTTMLLRVDPDRNAIALFSLPRDLKVEIPGYGTDKLNAAYAYGGPELTLETIQNLTSVPSTPNGLPIHHLVNVDFEGFARAVNAIDCVYIDVDRRYYHSNEETVEQYEEIDLQPGYQALCGFDALDYARFRHLDNDVVRAARQQDFVREARHKVPPEVLFADRKELIEIFTEHTTSDINNAETMLEVLKLFIEARDAPVKEVHFEGSLGPSFVTTTSAEIDKAVSEFLGIEDTPGARGETAAPENPDRITDEAAPDETGATPASGKKGRNKSSGEPAELVRTTYGKQLAKGIRARKVKLPIYYPTVLESGTDYAQKPRVYKINGTGEGSPPNGERAAYKWVFSRPALGEYYGFMATRWSDPPILDAAHDEREIDGRTYRLYYDGDRLRMVAWQDDQGSFWLSNTLIQSLSDREMIDIAKGMTELPRLGQRD